jgi:NTE family protein
VTSPELALVLSGGGARGFAHVGALQVMEELDLPIDLVVGVSMGSIIGAGYALGATPEQMTAATQEIQFRQIFRPRPGRLGLVDPVAMRDVLTRSFGNQRFADLKRELVVVSSSVTTGLPVVIRDGSLVDALLASCAIPLVFPPVLRDEDHLLDGGMIEAMPVEVAHELGARRVIAVDASTHARKILRLPGMRHAARGVVGLVGRRPPPASLDAVEIAMRALRHAAERPPPPPADVLIRPAFGLNMTFHYGRSSEMVARGRAAAERVRPRLIQLGDEARVAGQQ